MIRQPYAASTPQLSPQWLVQFQNRTHVIAAQQRQFRQNTLHPYHDIMLTLSIQTQWPLQHLVMTHASFPFMTVTTTSSIRGGKGGFGTLLKGQSKQAGAKLTTDFGACRDLQGRRLRHVNDEIKLRKWHDIQERKKAGELVDEDAEYMNTPSGLYNWHLLIPGWADVTNKSAKKLQSKIKHRTAMMEREGIQKLSEKDTKDRMHAAAVQSYVQLATDTTDSFQVHDAIQQGMNKMKRKRITIAEENGHDQQESILTLSGEFVVDQNKKTLQAKSEFSTMVLILEKIPTAPMYFEIKLKSSGISQVGWADLAHFTPNSDTGDGVGDDAGSYAFDGTRTRKFHNGKEEEYGQTCKADDVIGCLYDVITGEISYSKNGKSMGVAFVTEKNRPLVPALSCNQGEILDLHRKHEHMNHLPNRCIAVYDLMARSEKNDAESPVPFEMQDPLMPQSKVIEGMKPPKESTKPVEDIQVIDIEQYETVEQLESLGMDRLKLALTSMGCKCGGSAHERATRLFSLKGLEREDFPVKVRAKTFKF
jgi:SPRY domain/Replication stress response SDE2 C-terminal/Silencing defective 2 N-terminal ubiquitin domain